MQGEVKFLRRLRLWVGWVGKERNQTKNLSWGRYMYGCFLELLNTANFMLKLSQGRYFSNERLHVNTLKFCVQCS